MTRPAPIVFQKLEQVPERVVSLASMLWNRTGSWRYMRPLYVNKTPPCNQGCPAGNDVESFLAHVEDGRLQEAARVLLDENPLPGVCGRVCFHPCETACNRGQFDRPIAIHALERYVGDWARDHFTAQPLRPPTGKRVNVLGAGPAGLAAAYHLARMGHEVTVLDAQAEPGGVLRYGIPPYRLPRDVIAAETKRIWDMGVRFEGGVRVETPEDFAKLRDVDAVFVATGAYRSFSLKVAGEDAKHVYTGLGFLDMLARGETPAVGSHVAVIGDGNTAIDAARSARRLGAEVTIYSLTEQHEMPAFAEEIVEALREGVDLVTSVGTREILTKSGAACGLVFDRVVLGEPDSTGWRTPRPIEGSWFKIDATAVVIAIGQTGRLDHLGGEFPERAGRLQQGPTGRLGESNVFAGGDCGCGPNTVAHAIGDGKKAAVAIDRFLRGDESNSMEDILVGPFGGASVARYLAAGGVEGVRAHSGNTDARHVVAFKELNTNYFHESARAALTHRPVAARLDNFDEIVFTLDDTAAEGESRRCFHCGVCTECDNCYVFCPDVAIAPKDDAFGYDINLDYCKGCGVCVHECPRNAMAMDKE
ncbi:MAG: FAD-dependent oxidoreductase [Deltaproteobacteria bacterium]|nr:FAD-dependent oxidoreductase [Deltaproteobacteria bacterium]